MAGSNDDALLRQFLRHILSASVAFSGVAAAAMALETIADWIEAHHYSSIIAVACHGSAYFIFLSDTGFLLFFLTIQTLKLGKRIWRSFKEFR